MESTSLAAFHSSKKSKKSLSLLAVIWNDSMCFTVSAVVSVEEQPPTFSEVMQRFGVYNRMMCLYEFSATLPQFWDLIQQGGVQKAQNVFFVYVLKNVGNTPAVS